MCVYFHHCVSTAIILSRLSGYGSINIGLPPASPSNQEVDGVSEVFSECTYGTRPSLFLPKVVNVTHSFILHHNIMTSCLD